MSPALSFRIEPAGETCGDDALGFHFGDCFADAAGGVGAAHAGDPDLAEGAHADFFAGAFGDTDFAQWREKLGFFFDGEADQHVDWLGRKLAQGPMTGAGHLIYFIPERRSFQIL